MNTKPENGLADRGDSDVETMWAPWRMEYILAEKEDRCIFCDALCSTDELTLYKGGDTMVMMNKFPYINGHLLVAPVRHLAGLHQLSQREMGELLATVNRSVEILKKAMNPDGFNVGLNLGKVAGAGVEEHLHFHIVPRWKGDVNFMPVTANTKIISQSIKVLHRKLRDAFKKKF